MTTDPGVTYTRTLRDVRNRAGIRVVDVVQVRLRVDSGSDVAAGILRAHMRT